MQRLGQRDLGAWFQKGIVPKSEQTLEVSLEAYRVGQTDFLQLLDNWRQLLRFQIMLSQQESQLRQTLSSLERVVGGATSNTGPTESIPSGQNLDSFPPGRVPDDRRPPANEP